MKSTTSTKKALLLAILSTLLCVSMLIGTTFAWFTDTASTAVNKIQAGNLDVKLEYATEWDETGNVTKWTSAEGKTLPFLVNGAIPAVGTEIFWEPGCTYSLPELRVTNNGNLSLKYKVVITGINGSAELNEVIEWTIDGADLGIEYHLLANESNVITISGHMLETASNEYQGKTIDGIGITIYAVQDTAESDSNGNTYDENATYPVKTAEGLKEAFANGGVIAVANNVAVVPTVSDKTISTLFEQATVTADTTLDLAGKTWGVDASAAGEDYGKASILLLAVMKGTLTVTGNGVMNCEAGGNQVYGINVNGGHVVIENGTFYGAMTAIQVQKGTLEIKGGFFDMAPTCKAAVPQYAKFVVNCIDSAWKSGTASISITGGTFVNFDPSANPEGKGTSYVADGYKVVSETQANGEVWYTVVAK